MTEPFRIEIPRIRTSRLLLRELRVTDFDAFAANLTDPVATKFISGVVTERRAAWRTFSSVTGTWVLSGSGWWMLELLETGDTVGTVGAFFRESMPDLEIGWSIYRRFWRRGLATEAAAAALESGLAAHGRRRAIAHVAAENVASVAVAARLGMRFEEEVDFFGERIGRYAVER
jgi:RimJ/RimL family protein N-acetyltransferase